MKHSRYVNPWYFALLFTVIYTAFTYYLFYTLHPEGTPLSWNSFFFGMFSGLVTLLAVYISYRIIRQKQARMNNSVFYILLFFASMVLFLILYNLYWAWLIRWVVYRNATDMPMFIRQNQLMLGVLFAPVCIATILGLYNEKVFRLNQDILEKEKMLSESRLTQLQQQVDPHFLFNNLNILSALIRQSPEQAEIFTQRLSELYRYYLHSGKQPLSFLRDELRFMQDYLYLLQVRFGNAFHVAVTGDKAINEDECFLVAGTLQLLLENVVKHNAASDQEPMEVSVHIDQESLTMENPVRPREARSEGTGLKNLEKRYHLLTGKWISYETENNIFRVTIPLLKQLK
jgi:two-component system LytT family sensor kinase